VDTIGFGYKDAYSNALAYKAFNDMAELAAWPATRKTRAATRIARRC